MEPTVTDADVILGYINPDFFHGGRIHLDKELARKAIFERIAKPLGLDVEHAAFRIRKLVDGNMGNTISKETMLRGQDPRNFVLFSFGGAGPTHCCNYAASGHIPRLITFPLSPVFSAFSGSLMDIRHIHELSRTMVVVPPGHRDPVLDVFEYNAIVSRLLAEAENDGRAVGLEPENMAFFLELDMKYTRQLHVKRTRSPRLFLRDQADVDALVGSFMDEYGKILGSAGVYPEGGVAIESFVLHAVYPLHKSRPTKRKLHPSLPSGKARKGSRPVFWDETKGFQKTWIYDYAELRCGNVIDGPSIVEACDTTIVIPGNVQFSIDVYGNNLMEVKS